MCPCPARVAARYQASFAEQFERADQLGQVDLALARSISQSGLLDGDANDDKIRVTKKPVSSVSLNPSQSTMDLNQVVGIALEMLYLGGGSGEDLGAMVSSDGYVLDGHHRWAASIIASGEDASVRVWRAGLKGRDLIRVLNTITKGIYGIQKGNPGRGSIKNVTPAKVRAKLEEFLAHGRQSKKFSPSPELVREILVDNFGSAEEGIRVLSERANLVSKQIPSWAPSRDQMPAIKRKNAPGAAKILNQGVVDWAPPYWDEMQPGSGRVAARYLAAGLASELKKRVQQLIRDYDSALESDDRQRLRQIGAAFGDWFKDTFAVEASGTPRGGKATKQEARKFLWVAQFGPGQRSETDSLLAGWVALQPFVPVLVGKFSNEGGGALREIKTPLATYQNLKGLTPATFKKYVKALDAIFNSVRGWRRKALQGDFKVALAGPDKFRGTAGGKYNAPSDTMFVRATPKVMRRSGGTYGSPEYILVHELGHRYEKKVGSPSSVPYTTRYSHSEGVFGQSEAFAELFALGHFGIRSLRGTDFGTQVDQFEATKGRGGGTFKEVRELPPHLQRLMERVAARYRIRQAAYWAAAELQRGPRTASSHEMTGDVLAAFGEAFYLTPHGKQAGLGSLRNLAKRLKQLGKLFTKAPRLWEKFKRLVGIESLTDLPRALKDLAQRGFAALKKVVQRMFSTMPLKIYTLRGGLNDVLSQVLRQVPGLEKFLRRVKGKGDELGRWLKEKAPALSSVLIVAIFLFIWLNVVEFEWNLNDLTDALMGNIGLGDLLASLPGSAIGFLMNSLGFGVFTLLPATIVLRVLWLMHKGYLVWDGRRFDLDEVALQRDGFAIGAAR